ncbi:helix-turn-helix domain-containing protein [Nocardia rhizosphaerae]|uniref:MerR family transcriptional regulator n=1 Tax=Nocardia rhizosphaerae TaxID=1691571 RepID=A0ABV8LBH2_9NOCA
MTDCPGTWSAGTEVPADTSGYLQIGQVAELTDLSLKSIRHWDEVGLVQPSARSAGGFRLYTAADVDRMLLIRRMKPLGFSLTEMKHLLDAIDILDDPTAPADRHTIARADLRVLRDKAADSAERLRKHLAYAEEFTDLLTTRATTDPH